ncbi:MAG TPA: anthranilate phosphoribosyltransferase [Dehalococcoidia bacterium]|nr:anthranilate phosphoribosyltransferase [Dehalococcoidia bacterium]
MSITEALSALINERRDLTQDEAALAMDDIFSGNAPPAVLAAFLTALRMKGETVDEVAGMASVMREHALHVEAQGPLLDTCGTGGDGRGSFNVSTASAFVAAGAGGKVAKHGNRAMTSGCGSADVLEALGARIDLAPQQVAQCIDETGFGFMFAQAFHPSMKHAAPTRRELGIRTVFNILGPLTNPAGATHQLLGVADPAQAHLMAGALERLGSVHVIVVHGHDGSDELTLSGANPVVEMNDGDVTEYNIDPRELGLPMAMPNAIKGGTPEENAATLTAVLSGEPGAVRHVVLLNSAAALVAGDLTQSLHDGLQMAADSIDSGAAKDRLTRYIQLTKTFA